MNTVPSYKHDPCIHSHVSKRLSLTAQAQPRQAAVKNSHRLCVHVRIVVCVGVFVGLAFGGWESYLARNNYKRVPIGAFTVSLVPAR